MLRPRFAIPRPLTFCLWLGSFAALAIWGCQGPDTFLRKPADGGGTGGNKGSGGSFLGAGGHFGAGGSSGGSFGSGGAPGVGGHIGSGGSSAGGTTGSGGARDGGADATGSGGAIRDASSDSEGGVVGGNGPCAGLCANPVILTMTSQPAFGLGAGATCHEIPGTVGHIVCGNFTTKVLSINGMAVVCPDVTSVTITVPPTTLNGGYCIQSTAGEHDYAYFSTY